MLVRLYLVSHEFGLVEMLQSLALVADSHVRANQGDERVEHVPLVVRSLHQLVRLLVFGDCLVVLTRALVHRAEVSVAERYAELVVDALVQFHRLAEIRPCRVSHAAMTEYRAEIGVVDSLPQIAVQLLFALKRHSQSAVGTSVVAQCKVNVAQSVKRNHTILLRVIRLVAPVLAYSPRPIMIVLRQVEHTHTPVVGTYIIKRLHNLQRVAESLRLLQSFAVQAQRVVKLTVVAHLLSHQSVGDDAAEHVALFLHALLQHGERVDIARRRNDAVKRFAFGTGNLRRFLSTRNQQDTYYY